MTWEFGKSCLICQSCPTLCNPMDCSPPSSSVHGISQARILEWVAISSSGGSSQPRDWIYIFCISRQILYSWATREAQWKHSVTSVQFSHSVVSDSLWLHEPQHARPPCPSATPRDYSNSCPYSQWCHPAISSSVVPFSSCPQSLQASGSFPMSQLYAWSGQSFGVSASASVLPVNTQDWSPVRWTGSISLLSKGLSRVFSKTTVQKQQFFRQTQINGHCKINWSVLFKNVDVMKF